MTPDTHPSPAGLTGPTGWFDPSGPDRDTALEGIRAMTSRARPDQERNRSEEPRR
ncbi:hypothetical protein ACFC26_09790 [Kitasatospora purpeofusca]|uniref:hypothetical protein n=1 Tax=Kitasatospora purpeofusca TaxID=67352 RepID=UPI0035DB118B